LGLALLLMLLMAPSALAVDPNVAVGGPGSHWFSGSWLFQSGTNCSILGGAYPETMVSGIASYGGTSSIPAVGDGYYTALLLSVPGNPCGTGSSAISTDVILPPNTTIDTSRAIKCFGQPSSASTFSDITNETWSFLGSSGRYCPTQALPSSLHSGAWNIGFRPLASGQLFQVFVPVKSTAALNGAGANPVHEFRWLTDSTGVYSNPGQSYVWANVLPSSSPSGPFVYFERPALPYWKADAPNAPVDSNRMELWANVYTAGWGGTLCYELRRVRDNSYRGNCTLDPGYSQTVPAGLSLVQVLPGSGVTGPNGGYVPNAWFDGPTSPDPEWDEDISITWTFTPSGPGAPAPVSKTETFHTLAGPDSDGDGIADIHDTCPTVKGTLANGCQPAIVPDPDGDGIYGAADLCPASDGKGALNGCPGGIVPANTTPNGPGSTTTGPGPRLGGNLGIKSGAKIKRKALLKGVPIKVTCSSDSTASLVLSITKKTAKTLKIKAKGRQLTIASARGQCKANGGGTLKLKPGAKYKGSLGRAKKAFPATLGLSLNGGGATAAAAPVAVKVG
jgi:hypothetical protein